ncbi:MAG: EthD domain-containing protein [Anaerovoracaceae bacterium]
MAKFKLFGLIPKKKGISSDEFHDHYRHPHGTLGLNISTLRSYVQSHQINTPFLNEKQYQFDAIAEIWLDSVSDVLNFREEPSLVKYIIDDELNFVDMENLEFLATEENVLISSPDARDQSIPDGDRMWSPFNRPVSIKVLQFIGLEGRDYWPNGDALELSKRLSVFRHVECYPSNAIHNDEPPFIGARELWWPTLSAFKKAVEKDPDAFSKLVTDVPDAITLLVQAERWL